jgi:prepilin-type N-terminal cleavage/methylation domain-containing protein
MLHSATANPSGRARDGFTLVELLVVIGIIALLIALLMPALTQARLAAINTQCLSNMKQVYTAIMMYTNEYNGYFPPTTGDEANNYNLGPSRNWGDKAAYDQFVGASWDCPQIYAPMLDPYLNNNETVMVCAAIQYNGLAGRSPAQDPPLDELSGYTFYTGINGNSNIGLSRYGEVRDSDLRPAGYITAPAATPLPIFLSCSNLFGYDTASQGSQNRPDYWGFSNTYGNFGQVHGGVNPNRDTGVPGASQGGTQMNVMGLDGGVTRVYSNVFPLTVQ